MTSQNTFAVGTRVKTVNLRNAKFNDIYGTVAQTRGEVVLKKRRIPVTFDDKSLGTRAIKSRNLVIVSGQKEIEEKKHSYVDIPFGVDDVIRTVNLHNKHYSDKSGVIVHPPADNMEIGENRLAVKFDDQNLGTKAIKKVNLSSETRKKCCRYRMTPNPSFNNLTSLCKTCSDTFIFWYYNPLCPDIPPGHHYASNPTENVLFAIKKDEFEPIRGIHFMFPFRPNPFAAHIGQFTRALRNSLKKTNMKTRLGEKVTEKERHCVEINCAIYRNNIEFISSKLKKIQSLNEIMDLYRRSPLHEAVAAENDEIIKLLLERMVKEREEKFKEREIREGRRVERELERTDVNHCDSFGLSALLISCGTRNHDNYKLVYESGGTFKLEIPENHTFLQMLRVPRALSLAAEIAINTLGKEHPNDETGDFATFLYRHGDPNTLKMLGMGSGNLLDEYFFNKYDRLDASPVEFKFVSGYKIKARVGHGRTGHVFLLVKRSTGKLFAAKVTPNYKFGIKESFEASNGQFGNYGEFTAKMRGVIPDFPYKNKDGECKYLVPALLYDYYKGGSLDKYLESTTLPNGMLPTDLFLDIAEKLVIAVQSFHKSDGLVHRDIAPRNFLLSTIPKKGQTFYIYIADYDQARKPNEEGLIARDDDPKKFDAPEVWITGFASQKSDIWSLGLTLFDVFTRRRIKFFDFNNSKEQESHFVSLKKESRRYFPLNAISKDFILFDVVQQMLAMNPDDRPTLEEVLKWVRVKRNSNAPLHDKDVEIESSTCTVVEGKHDVDDDSSHFGDSNDFDSPYFDDRGDLDVEKKESDLSENEYLSDLSVDSDYYDESGEFVDESGEVVAFPPD